MTDNKFYVYVDWTTEELPRPYYVGYGNRNRINLKRRNKHHTNVRNKYGFKREVVYETYDEQDAKQKEIEFISKHGTFVLAENYCFGVNYTIGGDGKGGRTGRLLSEEHKQIISEANSHPKSEETKTLMTIAARERANNPEWIKKMSEVAKARWKNKECVEKFKLSTTGKKRTDEQKAGMAAALAGTWTKERLERHCERLKTLWQNPEYHKKQMNARLNKSKNKKEKSE